MNKAFDLIKETFRGKSLYRILFNWQVARHCVNLEGVCVDLACGKKPASYWRYWKINSSRLVRIDASKETEPDIEADLNQGIPLEGELADNIFFFNSLYLIANPEKLLAEIHRVLKKGGQVFFTAEFIKSEESQVSDWQRWTSRKLKDVLSQIGFIDVQIKPIGGRYSAIGNLDDFSWGQFFLVNLFKIPYRACCLLFDKITPKKLKNNYPCPISWFIVAKK